jgi:hypothetical protein
MGSEKDRVHPRYRVDLVATVRWRREVLTARVFDVSLGGAFLVGDKHPNLRELVRIDFELPDRTEPFSVHGMAVNFARLGDLEGRPPGFGVQLYAMDREMQRQWAQFIEGVKKAEVQRLPAVSAPSQAKPSTPCVNERDDLPPLVIPQPFVRTPTVFSFHPHASHVDTGRSVANAPPTASGPMAHPAGERPRTPAPPPVPVLADDVSDARAHDAPSVVRSHPSGRPSAPAGTRRPISLRPEGFSRGVIEFEVDMRSMEELELFYERDASVGGMFIPTELELRPRSPLKVLLRHPLDGRFFELDARVRHIERDLDSPGLGVEFVDFGKEKRAALRDFVYGREAKRLTDRGVDGVLDFGLQGAASPRDGSFDEVLSQFFEPWGGDETPCSWVPPQEEDLDSLFAVFDGVEASGLRRSLQPSRPPSEAPPDFRLSIPSWTQLEVASPSVVPLDEVIDLTEDASIDLVEATPLPQEVGVWTLRRAVR